jgi:hypothetical protein
MTIASPSVRNDELRKSSTKKMVEHRIVIARASARSNRMTIASQRA